MTLRRGVTFSGSIDQIQRTHPGHTIVKALNLSQFKLGNNLPRQGACHKGEPVSEGPSEEDSQAWTRAWRAVRMRASSNSCASLTWFMLPVFASAFPAQQ